MTVNQYLGASGILPKYVLPEKTRMVSVVCRCIAAVEIAFGVSYDAMKSNKRDPLTMTARYAAIRLISESTNLAFGEIDRVFRMDRANSKQIRNMYDGRAPAMKAMYNATVDIYNEMVRVEYDENIPF